ncbi:MAG: hypothetical protein JO006_15155 [Paucibacter sp.]|nr:hypothetical protein [Roseateles sp.]
MTRARKALPAQVDGAHLISAGMLASVRPRPLIEQEAAWRQPLDPDRLRFMLTVRVIRQETVSGRRCSP